MDNSLDVADPVAQAGRGLVLAAPAKINLNLLVGPRRPDGFHDVDSFVARITLYDTVELQPRDDGQLRLEVLGPDCGPPDRNLALQAARLLAGDAPRGADIRLTKRIPLGAGLGGGSSDAAAALAGLNRLWGLHLPAHRLAEMGAALGSDVPLFLGPPAARVTGRGELVRPVEVHPFHAVLLLPGLHVPTADVYRAFDTLPPAAGGQLDEALLASPPSAWRGLLVNDLLPAAQLVCPALAAWREAITRAGLPVSMSGSGSSLFLLCDDHPQALAARRMLPPSLAASCLLVRNEPC